jgi:hypothetical protein
MRAREHVLLRLLLAVAVGCTVMLFAAAAVLFATQQRASGKAPDFRVVRIGGIEYESMQGRPLDLADPVDRAIAAGLPAAQRRLEPGQALFGAFIASTNDSSAPLRTAGRIELRDQSGHVYRPLALPAGNPYAYAQRQLRPGTRIPALGSVADDDLAATGRLLLFRIPRRAYAGQTLELVIHDPSDPATTASLII